MGGKISLDEQNSNLDEILESNISDYSKNMKFENNIPDCVTYNIKVKKLITKKI